MNLTRNIIGFVFSLTAALLVFATAISGADFDYSIDSQYQIEADGSSSVQHIISVENNTGDDGPKTFTMPVIGGDPTNFSSSYQDGEKLKTRFNEEQGQVIVELPDTTTGKNKKWSFEIDYESSLLANYGDTKIIQIPPLGDLGVALSSQSFSIAADLDLGFGTARGPNPNNTDIVVGNQVVSYLNEDGPFEQSATLLFGESAVSIVEVDATLKNDGWWWKTVEFSLPPDTNQQQVILESIEPNPSSLRLDTDGNVIAGYNLRPKQSVEVKARALVRINSLTYDLTSTEKVNDIDPELVARYTSSTSNWTGGNIEVDITSDDSVSDVISKVHRAVADEAQNDTFSAVDLAARDHGLKYSDQLVGELRSRGIPARLVLGKVWSNGSRLLESPLNHAWAEAFAPGLGWMTLDPLMSSNTDYFGTTNVTHIGLVLWGIADNRPPINLDTVNVRYTDKEFSTMGDQYEVSAKKYIVLPGISVLSISVQTPPGSIQDNTAVRTGSDSAVIPLGSLAPLQTARTRTLRMGGGAFNSESIEFGTLNGENLNVTATTDTQLSYLLVFYELGAILLLAVIVGVVKLRRRRLSRRKTSHDSVLMHEEAEGDNIEDQNLVAATDTLMEDEQPSDTLPEVVDPAGLAPEDSPQNAPLPEEAGPKDGTIKQSNARSDDQPKPPYRHLIQ